jgi:hypothetical protein
MIAVYPAINPDQTSFRGFKLVLAQLDVNSTARLYRERGVGATACLSLDPVDLLRSAPFPVGNNGSRSDSVPGSSSVQDQVVRFVRRRKLEYLGDSSAAKSIRSGFTRRVVGAVRWCSVPTE